MRDLAFVDQTLFGPKVGNCTAACIASLTDAGIHDVPDFNKWADVFGHWALAAEVWLRNRGWDMSPAWDYALSSVHGFIREDEITMAGGVNPDGVGHMVLWKNDKMVHDPNPSRAGLLGNPEFLITIRRLERKAKP